MKTLKDFRDEFMQFLELPDDKWIFTKGACHAFALELVESFRRDGREADLYYVSCDHPDIANHVVVKSGNDFWDAEGKNTAEKVLRRWCKSDESQLYLIKDSQVLTVEYVDFPPGTSYLGLLVNPEFLDRARARARKFIADQRLVFGNEDMDSGPAVGVQIGEHGT